MKVISDRTLCDPNTFWMQWVASRINIIVTGGIFWRTASRRKESSTGSFERTYFLDDFRDTVRRVGLGTVYDNGFGQP